MDNVPNPPNVLTKVRAKVRCNSITDYGNYVSLQVSAVYGKDNSENGNFAKATPTLNLTMSIDAGMPASGFFKPGDYYYLDFIPTEKE